MKKIIASGPVIIYGGKLLVTKDSKDNFYKIPGGTIQGKENLEETCLRELKEETGFDGRIIKKLSTMKLDKNPTTKEKMKIILHHYQCKLINAPKNYNSFNYDGHKVKWVSLIKLTEGKISIAPNINFLINQKDINL